MVRFIPAQELKARYDVFGHFYSIKLPRRREVACRSVLEIAEPSAAPSRSSMLHQRKPDAVFVMMNPGSSRPLVEVDNRIHLDAIDELPISLVPTKPDTTQYQVMRLMHYCQWRHVRVLNLSDLRCTRSTLFFKQFAGLERELSFDAHSIFSDRRREELALKLTRYRYVPVIRAWGVSPKLDPLIDRCLSKLIQSRGLGGLMKEGTSNKYLHPLPSLQKQKIAWINRMVEQCRG